LSEYILQVISHGVLNWFNKEKVCKNLLKMLKNLSGKTSLSVWKERALLLSLP